jgi:hypothetical protein
MTQRAIILTFVLGITAYVFAVFLWPAGNNPSSKTTRLSGEPVVAAFQPERFGVPAPPQQVAPG